MNADKVHNNKLDVLYDFRTFALVDMRNEVERHDDKKIFNSEIFIDLHQINLEAFGFKISKSVDSIIFIFYKV